MVARALLVALLLGLGAFIAFPNRYVSTATLLLTTSPYNDTSSSGDGTAGPVNNPLFGFSRSLNITAAMVVEAMNMDPAVDSLEAAHRATITISDVGGAEFLGSNGRSCSSQARAQPRRRLRTTSWFAACSSTQKELRRLPGVDRSAGRTGHLNAHGHRADDPNRQRGHAPGGCRTRFRPRVRRHARRYSRAGEPAVPDPASHTRIGCRGWCSSRGSGQQTAAYRRRRTGRRPRACCGDGTRGARARDGGTAGARAEDTCRYRSRAVPAHHTGATCARVRDTPGRTDNTGSGRPRSRPSDAGGPTPSASTRPSP